MKRSAQKALKREEVEEEEIESMEDHDDEEEEEDGDDYSLEEGSDYGSSDGDEDEDEDGEEGDDGEDSSHPAPKKQKTGGATSAFALPTKTEQMQLRETQQLMRTNLLQLQVSEMLEEVRDEKAGVKNKVSDWLSTFREALSTVGRGIKEPITLAWLHRNGVRGINLDGPEAASTSIVYSVPASVDVIGSYKLRSATKPFLNIDLSVTMPTSLFDSKDLLNFSYFNKRKLYLGAVAQQLQAGAFSISETLVTTPKGDFRKPILVVKPNVTSKYIVRIHFSLPSDQSQLPFKLSHLRPLKNNCRPLYWIKMLRENEKNKKRILAAAEPSKLNKKQKPVEVAPEALAQYSSANLDASMLPPTTRYNMSILEDLTMNLQSKILERCVSAIPCLRDCIVLLKVWISQRGFRTGYDSMDAHEASMIAAYLCASKRILSQMTPLMAFTAVLKFISEADFSKEAHSFNVREGGASFVAALGDASRPAAMLLLPVGADADEACDGVVTESTVHYNLLWHWSESSLSILQQFARSSLRLIQNDSGSTENLFRDLFMTKSNFFESYDLFFHFPVFSSHSLLNWSEQESFGSEELRKKTQEALCDLTAWENATSSAIATLSEALGSRVSSIKALFSPLSSKHSEGKTQSLAAFSPHAIYSSVVPVWSLSDAEPGSLSSSFDENSIICYATVGLVMNRENAHQRVTRGPFAEDAEQCEKFRQFWGSKSQLRRFHDGSIVEACVWGSATQQASNQVPRGESIITEIVNYIMHRHLPMYCGNDSNSDARCIRAVCNQLDYFLPASTDVTTGQLISSSSSDVFQPVADAATLCRRAVEVVDQLRGIVASKLDGLALGIESFVVMSPELRYTSFFPPAKHPIVASAGGEGKDEIKANSKKRITKAVQVFPCVLNLQRSGRWPSELVALRKIKTAMLIRIGDNLKEQFQIRSIPNEDYLDVLFQGYIFRFRLYTENEVMLLLPNIAAFRRVTGVTEAEASTFSVVDLKGNKQVEITYEADQLVRQLVIGPMHHSFVHSLYSQNPSYADTVRLLERWVAGHLFSNHFDHETLELLVASVYLTADKNASQPQSATAGFLRCLSRIAEFEWNSRPLIVDFTGTMSAKDIEYIHNCYDSKTGAAVHHKRLPMHIVSSYDKQRGYAPGYGSSKPEGVVLKMVVAAARQSVDQLISWMTRGGNSSSDAASLYNILSSPTVRAGYNAVLKLNRNLVCKKISSGLTEGQNRWLSMLAGSPAFHTELFSNLSNSELNGQGLCIREGPAPHPIQTELVDKLQRKYRDYALFFWDHLAGDYVGVVWRPHAFLPKRFSVLESKFRLIAGHPDGSASTSSGAASSASAMMYANAVEIVADMIASSEGLLDSVEFL